MNIFVGMAWRRALSLIFPTTLNMNLDIDHLDIYQITMAAGRVETLLGLETPFIKVDLDRYTMRASTKYNKVKHISGYKIGLASNKPDGQWNVERWSELIPQNIDLSPGETKQIENAQVIIPIDNLPSLEKYWLVLAVVLSHNEGQAS